MPPSHSRTTSAISLFRDPPPTDIAVTGGSIEENSGDGAPELEGLESDGSEAANKLEFSSSSATGDTPRRETSGETWADKIIASSEAKFDDAEVHSVTEESNQSPRVIAFCAKFRLPALYENHVFPVFLMWETDLWSTLKNRLADLVTVWGQEPSDRHRFERLGR